jgi:hypothetical protein
MATVVLLAVLDVVVMGWVFVDKMQEAGERMR